MSKKRKNIKQAKVIEKKREILVSQPGKSKKQIATKLNFNAMPIGWNFKYIELNNPLFRCSFKDFLRYSKEIVDRFEEKSLVEISRETEHSHSWEDSSKLHPELQKILNQKNINQDVIYQLHMNSKFRIWGFIRLNIFHIICFDHDHNGYKTFKRHT